MNFLSSFGDGILLALLAGSFLKILIALSILRFGVGLVDSATGAALLVAATILALSASGPRDANVTLQTLEHRADASLIEKLTSKTPETDKTVAHQRAVVAASVLGDLKSGMFLGAIVLVPFLVIDLLVATLLTVLGVVSLPALVVALPLKLLVFLAVDGWGAFGTRLLS